MQQEGERRELREGVEVGEGEVRELGAVYAGVSLRRERRGREGDARKAACAEETVVDCERDREAEGAGHHDGEQPDSEARLRVAKGSVQRRDG